MVHLSIFFCIPRILAAPTASQVVQSPRPDVQKRSLSPDNWAALAIPAAALTGAVTWVTDKLRYAQPRLVQCLDEAGVRFRTLVDSLKTSWKARTDLLSSSSGTQRILASRYKSNSRNAAPSPGFDCHQWYASG